MKRMVFCLIMYFCFSISLTLTEASAAGQQEKDVTAKSNLSSTMEQIANHLEFLGYRIDKKVPGDKKPYFIAYHSTRNNLVVIQYEPNFIYFRTNLTSVKPPSSNMDAFVNKANHSFSVSRFYYDKNEKEKGTILRFSAMYIGEYSKEIFGKFIDMYKRDQDMVRGMENFTKTFLKD